MCTRFIQIDGPSSSVWTLPYLVTVNDEYPFGMFVSYPTFFAGQSDVDGRLMWYSTSSNKDLIMTAEVWHDCVLLLLPSPVTRPCLLYTSPSPRD